MLSRHESDEIRYLEREAFEAERHAWEPLDYPEDASPSTRCPPNRSEWSLTTGLTPSETDGTGKRHETGPARCRVNEVGRRRRQPSRPVVRTFLEGRVWPVSPPPRLSGWSVGSCRWTKVEQRRYSGCFFNKNLKCHLVLRANPVAVIRQP
jgi:hypothetical protein